MEAAIKRLEIRRMMLEAQINLSSLDLIEVKTELEKLHDVRRELRIMGRPDKRLIVAKGRK